MSKLEQILAGKRIEVAQRRLKVPDAELVRRAGPPRRDFIGALSETGGRLRVIAEVKRASPSAGVIDATLDPAGLARSYRGAAAISVLTDGPHFGGSMDDLRAVREAVELPILRKDFVIDAYQLLEAHEAGADAALLIVAALERPQLKDLLLTCDQLGLAALVEVHDRRELDVATSCGAHLIGVNNRNLSTFEVDLATSEALLPLIAVRAVAESGVRTVEDARRLRRAGAANLLIGEALVRNPALLAEILAIP